VRLRTLTALLLVLAACVAVGCGADEETKPSIPASATAEFMVRLTSVENRFNFGDGACNDIPSDQRLVNDEIARLPSSVDGDVRNALQDSFDHLFDLTSEQCDKTKGQETDTNTETTDTTETQTETTDTTETTPTDTTSTETTPTDTSTTPGAPPGQGGEPPGQGGENPGGGAQGPGL
jgi:hypothetical protein